MAITKKPRNTKGRKTSGTLGSKSVSSLTREQVVSAFAKAGNTKAQQMQSTQYSSSNPYTKPLSAQGQANVKALTTPKTANGGSVTKVAQTSALPLIGNIGTNLQPTPKHRFEFNVLPGVTPGRIDLGHAGTTPGATAQSTLNPRNVEDFAKVEEDARAGQREMLVASLIPTSGLSGAALQGGLTVKNLLKVAPKFKNLLSGKQTATVINSMDDAARQLRPNQVRIPPRGTKLPTTTRPVPPAMSNLGNIIKTSLKYGTGAALTGTALTSTVGTVRNALPPTQGTPSDTTGAPDDITRTGGNSTVPPSSGAQSTKQSDHPGTQRTTSQSYAPSSYSSVGMSGPSFVGGGSSSTGFGGGSPTTTAGASALRGEQLTEQQTAAQARAIELQRQQAASTGVAPSPVGDQVDLAGLQELRDKAKDLLNTYGSEAATMPEFKAAIQGMIAGGIQNLRALQPTPPEPVIETPEETELYNNLEPNVAFSVRQTMDDFRRKMGMPALESKKADLNRQMTAVNQAYQAVIDQIKDNPNLPKGLAARRLTEQFEDQKFALNTILSELDIIQDQIDSGNEQLENYRADMGLQLQYDKQATDAQDKQYERMMDKFGLMVESRAIGGMDETEMRQWAAVTGISLGAIRKLRDNALDSESEREVSFERDANDNLLMVTYDKKNPLDKTVERIGSVKSPKGGTGMGGAGGFSDLDLLANTVLGTGSVAKQERDFATYEQLKAQNPKRAEEWLYGKVANGLNATQKNDFRVFGSVVDGADSALAKIQQFANANPGVYAALYNKAAPYLTASRDQNYVKLMQQVTSIGNEYRNAIFGASLTGNEQTEGLKVVIGNNDDLPTIITKLQGLSEYSQTIRQRIILDAAGQIGTSLSDNGPGTIGGGSEAEYSMDDEAFNSVAGTETGGSTGYFSRLWDALRGN